MSFFFDVWTSTGFVLASDVRFTVNDELTYIHKIVDSGSSSRVNCAIAVCGDYPENCLNYFTEATLAKDSLREVAQRFAGKWTERYAGTEDYSAVHLVGFESIPASEILVPQMWFWTNWSGSGYYSQETLVKQLDSFSNPIPDNNHIPQKIQQLTGRFPGSTLEQEGALVTSFLQRYQPYFTWNGDTSFWRSAADSVGAALNLLKDRKSSWTIDEIGEVTGACLEFLVKVGGLLPESTVAFSEEGRFDMLSVTPEGSQWIEQADIPE